ncbi:MAG: response regulator [Pseudomonadota bacterium]
MPKTKILLVDDMSSMRGVIKLFLADADYLNIVEASDGQKALQVLECNKIDLIISDWDMPQMTGLDLLKAVNTNDKFKDIPFLMLTATSKTEKVQSAIEAGVSDYIAKPFRPKTLIKKIESILQK